jgi:esterase
MQHISVNGYDMSYAEAGQGVPLVLIHGSLCDYRYWGLQIPALSKGHRVVAVSLRHCYPERWDGTGSDYTCAQHAADVGELIATLGGGAVHLLGHSRGGYVAFTVARQFPERVRSLTLADPGGELDDSLGGASPASAPLAAMFGDCAASIKAGDIDGALARFNEVINGPGSWEKMPAFGKTMMRDNAYTLIGQMAEGRLPFSRAAIQEIRAPTLVVNGARSPAFFHRIGDAMAAYLRDGRRLSIDGAGHPMNAEQPNAFNTAVLEFLAGH